MLKIKEEYNKRREEIYYMIRDAYMDKCILEYIERINKLVECGERHFESNSKHVMQHMIYLTISDLVLNICYDSWNFFCSDLYEIFFSW